MRDSFDVQEISTDDLDVVVGGKQGDPTTVASGLAHAIGGVIGKVSEGVSAAIHMF